MYIKKFTVGLSGINLLNKLVLELHIYYYAIRKNVKKEFRCWQELITMLDKMLPMLAKKIGCGWYQKCIFR
jgi:hypothetical protein